MPALRNISTTSTISWDEVCQNLGQGLQFDLAEVQLQRVAGDVKEIIGRIGESHV